MAKMATLMFYFFVSKTRSFAAEHVDVHCQKVLETV